MTTIFLFLVLGGHFFLFLNNDNFLRASKRPRMLKKLDYLGIRQREKWCCVRLIWIFKDQWKRILTFNNSTFCSHSVFIWFVRMWEERAIISPYSINWLAFITENECVHCAVRAESTIKIQVNFSL